MSQFLELPDLEAVASVTLRSAALVNLDTRVYSSIPGKSPVFPLAVVKRVGGVPAVTEMLDLARIQVDVWGGAPGDGPGAPSKSMILDISQAARVALLELRGTAVTSPVSAFITDVRDALGLSWQPDPTTSRDRYVFAMWVYGKPLAAPAEVGGTNYQVGIDAVADIDVGAG